MLTLHKVAVATTVWFDTDMLWVRLEDGRHIGTPLAYFPRLLRASAEERGAWVLSGGGRGIHWDSLDEDVSVEGIVAGVPDRTTGSKGMD